MNRIFIIGEKLISSSENVKDIIYRRDRDKLLELAGNQINAGASALDVNTAILMEQEEETIFWAIETILSRFETTVCADTPRQDLLHRIGERFGDRVILNSITADRISIEKTSEVVRKNGSQLIIILKSSRGIPPDPEGRLELARESADILQEMKVTPDRVYFDPVVTSVGTSSKAAATFLRAASLIKAELPEYRTVGGLSNVSFGLPMRSLLNSVFMAMAIASGIDAVICDPSDSRIRETIRAAEAAAGMDPGCSRLISYYRKKRLED